MMMIFFAQKSKTEPKENLFVNFDALSQASDSFFLIFVKLLLPKLQNIKTSFKMFDMLICWRKKKWSEL